MARECSKDSKDLGCALSQMRLQMSDISFGYQDYFGFNITELKCSDLNLGSITSKYDKDNSSVTLGISGLGLSCTANYEMMLNVPLLDSYQASSGTIELKIDPSSTKTELEVELVKGNFNYFHETGKVEESNSNSNETPETPETPETETTNETRDAETETGAETKDQPSNSDKSKITDVTTAENLPIGFFVKSCDISLKLDESFKITDKDENIRTTINYISDAIKSFVPFASNFGLCTLLAGVLENKASPAIKDVITTYAVPYYSVHKLNGGKFPYTPEKWYREEPKTDSTQTDDASDYTEGFARANSPLPSNPPSANPGSLDLYKSSLIDLLNFVSSEFLAVNGTLPIGKVLSGFEKDGMLTLGMFGIKLPAFNLTEFSNGALNGMFAIDNLGVGGLGTIDVFRLAKLLSSAAIDNAFGMKNIKLALDASFSASLPISFDVAVNQESETTETARRASMKTTDDFAEWEANLSLKISLADLFARAVAYLQVNEAQYEALDKDSLICIPCMKSLLLPGTDIPLIDGSLKLDTFELNIAAASGKAKRGDTESTIEESVAAFVDGVYNWVKDGLNDYLPYFIGGALQKWAQPAASTWCKNTFDGSDCERAESSKASDVSLPGTLAGCLVAGAASVAVILVFFLSKARNQKKNELSASVSMVSLSATGTTTTDSEEQATENSSEEDKEAQIVTPETGIRSSLFFNEKIPIGVRIALPILTLFTAALFLSSNTSHAASVVPMIYPRKGEDPIELGSLFDFGLGNTITDMWKAGVYPLSILVAILSGAWPYIKILLILVTWFCPKNILPVKKREWVLILLDAFGKWSMLDSFMMVMMVVGFRFNIDFPTTSDAIENPTSVTIAVKAVYGMSSFCVATVVSLILSHVAIHFHRSAENPKPNAKNEDVRVSVMTAYKEMNGETKQGKVFFYGIPIGLLITFVFVIVGLFVPSFKFVFKGAAGSALNLLRIASENSYSTFSLAVAFPSQSTPDTAVTIFLVELVFVVTVIVFPIIHLIALSVLWGAPIKRKYQRSLYVFVEIMNAWASIEVFVVTLLVSLLEIEQFAGFMVEDTCKAINPIIETYLSGVLEDSSSCFSVIATLESGVFCFLMGAIFYLICAWTIMRTCHKALAKADEADQDAEGEAGENGEDAENAAEGNGAVTVLFPQDMSVSALSGEADLAASPEVGQDTTEPSKLEEQPDDAEQDAERRPPVPSSQLPPIPQDELPPVPQTPLPELPQAEPQQDAQPDTQPDVQPEPEPEPEQQGDDVLGNLDEGGNGEGAEDGEERVALTAFEAQTPDNLGSVQEGADKDEE